MPPCPGRDDDARLQEYHLKLKFADAYFRRGWPNINSGNMSTFKRASATSSVVLDEFVSQAAARVLDSGGATTSPFKRSLADEIRVV
jgi:hypothetical protein